MMERNLFDQATGKGHQNCGSLISWLKILKRQFIFHFRRTKFLEITTSKLDTYSTLVKQLKPEIHLRIHVVEVYFFSRTQNLLIMHTEIFTYQQKNLRATPWEKCRILKF
jgi:hypothetical protein